MKQPLAWLVVLATATVSATCTHRVTQPSTQQETIARLAGWPGEIEGVVLRNGHMIELPSTSVFTVEGDSLILKRASVKAGQTASVDSIRIADVSDVMVRRTHTGRTIAAVVLISAAAIGLIAALSEEEPDPPPQTSCPFIYAYNGKAYVAVAEPLGGAISGGLQRTDLSQLEGLVLVDGSYHLLIANEMREVQHLDAFSLLTADHPEGTSVIADRAGKLYVAARMVTPVRAVSSVGEDLLPALRTHDQQWWSPGSSLMPFRDGHMRDTITLTFPRPAQASARLVLHARTSQLGAHTLKVMLDLWGGEVDHWYGLLDGSQAARTAHEEWVQREELWVLKVWVREANGWVAQDVAVGGGPYISELQAINLDLSRVEGETVELRLHPARGYWDIDFAALDTARLAAPRVTELHITDADSLAQQDVRALLRGADGSHLIMAERGTRTGVKFAAQPPAPGMTRTVFSRSTGYYRLETERSGMRQSARLDSLWLQPGYAVKLAEQFHASRRQQATR